MLVYGQDKRVTDWIADQLGYPDSFVCSAAIGYEVDGELRAGVCFDVASATNVYAHIASVATVLPVRLLAAVASYAFVQLKAKRMTFSVYDNNYACIRLVESLGAELESRMKFGYEGGDSLTYVLWPTSRFFQRLLSTDRIFPQDTKHEVQHSAA